MTRILRAGLVSLSFLGAFACAGLDATDADFVKPDDLDGDGKADSSVEATILDFELDGELVTSYAWDTNSVIRDQLLYTIGHLNGDRSVGRLDRLELTNVTSEPVDGKTRVKYHAHLPVAWGSKTNLPTSYDFRLPRDVSYEGLEAFTTKYKESCVDHGAHDVTSGSMWYYFRPRASGCAFAPKDVVLTTATVVVSTVNTTGKYPEYHKVWEDQALKVVSIFGKYEDGATGSDDAGIAAYGEFVEAVRSALSAYSPTTVPATIPSWPGVNTPDVTFSATLPDGRKVEIVGLLVDNVSTASAAFYERYEQLSTGADLIAYNGHAGLGQNVRALARKGRFVAGKYLIVFMNGCDTYAYVDGSLAETRAAQNPDDPTGTKYMEIVTNAMPAFFASDAGATMALVRGLMNTAEPSTYEQMFKRVDRSQVVLVTGEQDNVYFPGYPGGGGGGDFAPLHEVASASQNQTLAFETGVAPAGHYVVALAHDAANPGGDADLYVRVGTAPTASEYDCRPYTEGSEERCEVTVTAPAKIFIAVAGYGAGENHFVLTADQVGGTPPPAEWTGLDETGTVAKKAQKRYETPALAPGRYSFTLSGDGDADLYVRVGTAPTTSVYDCRPYKSGSAESCVVDLAAAAPVHVMVRGYAASSSFRIVGRHE